MSVLMTSFQRLRKNPRLRSLPKYLSLLCILGGVLWLFLLPLDRYSRQTYISENALLPGQVHTYFSGSEQNIFRAYREELRSVQAQGTEDAPDTSNTVDEDRLQRISAIFGSAGLPTATQSFQYWSAGNVTRGTNIYSVLQAPRGDGTEAIVLLAPHRNAAGEDNTNGVTLLLTLARYFKRWSLWSKDIIFLITPDTVGGPQAWISAYHSTHNAQAVESLPLKSGALQGAVCIDLPFDHRFEQISISYDGVNGQLPNLDLVNTAVSVAGGQMGIGTSIQGMHHHDRSYKAHLATMLRGMSSQAAGYGTGAHSVFMPYHIDAITLTAHGTGWQDEMALGRTVESICRSLNNLLEHFHQSFFFYLLMQTNRFVSIGTYLPSAMAIAAGFTIMSISLWVRADVAETAGSPGRRGSEAKDNLVEKKQQEDRGIDRFEHRDPEPAEQRLLVPILIILSAHVSGLAPVYIISHVNSALLATYSPQIALIFLALPSMAASALSPLPPTTSRLTKSLSLLLLGLSLSALATLNFSLSLALGLLCTPTLLAPTSPPKSQHSSSLPSPSATTLLVRVILTLTSPPAVWLLAHLYFGYWLSDPDWAAAVLTRLAFGCNVLGAWGSSVGVWLVWWPAWAVADLLATSRVADRPRLLGRTGR